MESANEVIVLAILISSIVIVVLVVFSLLFFFLFVKKKKRLQTENEDLRQSFAETLLQSQLEIQEQTLGHIGREIHDNIGQVLSLVSLNLHTMVTSDAEKVKNTSALVTKAIDDLRSLSKRLNSDRVQQLGLTEIIKQEFQYLEKTGRYKTSLSIGKPVHLTEATTIILYRMIQEVINNIIKHAAADEVSLALFPPENENMIIIRDNGKGFDHLALQNSGVGLINLKQRAAMINASVDISSSSSGTSVNIFLLNP